MSAPTVSAIVVLHNGRATVDDCLTSLENSHPKRHELIVVDNRSTDGSADWVRTKFPDAHVFEYSANCGFGEGNNRAARVAHGDYLFLLNQDAQVQPDTIQKLVAIMEADPSVAIAGPMLLADKTGRSLCSAGLRANRILYSSDRGYGQSPDRFDQPGDQLGVTGAAMMIRRTVFEQLGGFDRRYFLYYEDLDLCIRAWIAGWKVRYVPNAVAYHPVKNVERSVRVREFLDTRNRWRTMLKNLSLPVLIPAWGKAVGFELVAAKNHLLNRRWQSLRYRVMAWAWLKLYFLDTLKERRRVAQLRKMPDTVYTRFFDDEEVRF